VCAEVTLTAPYATVTSLDRAHAHNDYEHRRPLFDALHHGFTSVEADIWLQDGELRVAHEAVDTVPGRTLESLHLEPLSYIVRANRGQVYPARAEPVQLLVDIKSDGAATYRALDKALQRHRGMLTRFGPDGTAPGAVEVVVSGNRPREQMASDPVRWTGRFWATPDQPGQPREDLWTALVDADVDHINTDDLAGLQELLLDRAPWTRSRICRSGHRELVGSGEAADPHPAWSRASRDGCSCRSSCC
jgi:hypothetical protein